ncbi:MAG: hypothetical protein AAF485_30605 [Chloroflexota bacterium]
MTGHTTQVWSVFFNPGHEGQLLTSGSGDGTAIIWDITQRQPLGPPLVTPTEIETLALSPDSQLLAVAGFDKTLTIWKLNLEPWASRACEIANRNLSDTEWAAFFENADRDRATCPGLPSPTPEAQPDNPEAE